MACVILGHGRKKIAKAVQEQLEELEYYCLFGYSHPLAEKFAHEIAQRTPGDLNHVFFTNSGSEAVETALKAARAFGTEITKRKNENLFLYTTATTE